MHRVQTDGLLMALLRESCPASRANQGNMLPRAVVAITRERPAHSSTFDVEPAVPASPLLARNRARTLCPSCWHLSAERSGGDALIVSIPASATDAP
ncbi:MAG: hypothetical protein JSS05_14410 [Proteobacteria bacterium]|nr:hypothetical protein [Pseudomonadota bacterium]